MIGDIIEVDGIEFEVVWSGGEGLVPDRRTKVTGTWTPPRRLYNKTGKHAKKGLRQLNLPFVDGAVISGDTYGRARAKATA